MILRYIAFILFSLSSLFATVDLNSATSKELLGLNGIGKAKASKIINYRMEHKCFNSIEELSQIDGISKKLIDKNRSLLTLGECKEVEDTSKVSVSSLKDVVLDPVNLFFVIIIFVLAILEYVTKKDLKSQIISVGVLGTFVGIFIGLQGFDPSDIINSVNHILVGLKTAFFTSIVGMSVATILSVVQKLRGSSEIG